MHETCYILDTAVFLNQNQSHLPTGTYYMPSSILTEILSRIGQAHWIVFKEAYQIKLFDVTPKDVKQSFFTKLPKSLLNHLSPQDLDVIRVALLLDTSTCKRRVILTDDYALQKVAYLLKIPCQGIMFPVIREQQQLLKKLNLSR